jgi:hypothetical protein
VQQHALHYNLSGQVCRQLGVHPRLLGRLTGNIWVNDSSGERVDIGLAVKNAKQGLCVPGEAQGRWCSLCSLLVVQESVFFGSINAACMSWQRVDIGLAVKDAKQGLCVPGKGGTTSWWWDECVQS